jgi:hypothetical protein
MSRCAQTDAVLEAAFGAGIANAQAQHAVGCSECARALAAARRFENELHDIGSELAPVPMATAEEVLMATGGFDRRLHGRVRWVLGAAGTAVVVGAFFIGGRWLGGTIGPLFEPQMGSAVNVAEAAELAGVPASGMLATDGGAVGVRARGSDLELILVRESTNGLEEHVLASAGRNELHIIRCGEVEIVWGHRPGIDRIEGQGSSATWDRQYAVFVFSGAPEKPVSVEIVASGRKAESLTFRPSELSTDECSVAITRSEDGP